MALEEHSQNVVSAGRLRPPLKWAGGKRWLAPQLLPLWEDHSERRLVEPFCGSLAVALELMPEKALLNDVNPHLMNFLFWLQRGLKVDIPLENDRELYYAHRVRFNEMITSDLAQTRTAASLFYYLNRTGYNGLCRFNKKGRYNVPFGRYKTIRYTTDFSSYQSLLSKWDLMCSDFEDIPIAESDFVYADPPYDTEFTQYSKEGFGWDDQVRLADWLHRHRGPVAASNQATSRVLELYKSLGFHIQILDAPRMISCTGDRTRAKEILATKGM